MNKLLVCAAVLKLCTISVAEETRVESLLAQSDSMIQEQFESILNSATSIRTEFDLWSNTEATLKVKALRESVPDQVELVKQLAIYAAAPGEEPSLYATVILEFLHLEPKVVISVLAPYLDSENENIRSFALDWFQSHDTRETGVPSLQTVNYRDYLDYVRKRLSSNQEVPAAFIEYIYKRSPDRALLVFNHATQKSGMSAELIEMRKRFAAEWRERRKDAADIPQEQDDIPQKQADISPKEILLAEHLVSSAIWLNKYSFNEQFPEALPEAEEQLAKLSEHSEWWVRLYVAEIMRQHRFLRQANILEKLSDDSNALVSKSAKSVLQ